ncbi:MAG: nucleotidyl transferase AbiEii/AbiGii toxin family protein [Thaumarchaeota archaeon]|nr:nucleotidyl transferase AbiEii/AbiGii toxin family protein [Nitrososphaerota archaeon]
MKEPVCLLGGWAVYLTVNAKFNKTNGRNYLGSRDIDLGFHIDPNWSSTELEKSAFAQSIKILKARGFNGLGSRFVKYYDINTKKELSEVESRKKPSYEMFQLYVDPMVDNIHKAAQKIVGFPLLDESLLSHVFVGQKFTSLSEFGGKFRLPTPEILIATKLKSVPSRNKDDKRIKDISDIYALLWYSEDEFLELKQKVQQILGIPEISDVVSKFTQDEYSAVSTAIGIGPTEISRVITDFAH